MMAKISAICFIISGIGFFTAQEFVAGMIALNCALLVRIISLLEGKQNDQS